LSSIPDTIERTLSQDGRVRDAQDNLVDRYSMETFSETLLSHLQEH